MRISHPAGIALGIGVLLLASCAQPQITRRYAEVMPSTEATKSRLTILADVVNPEKTPSQTLAQAISDRAQEVIAKAAIDRSGGGPAAAVKTLTAKIGEADGPQTDFSKFGRRIATVIGGELGDADRIESAVVTVELPTGGGATFGPVKQWATEYQIVDFGTMTFEQGRSLNAELTLAPPVPIVEGLTLGGEVSQTMSESIALKREIPHLTIYRDMGKRRMVLRHEGALGLSLLGATAVDVSVVTPSRGTVLSFVDGLDLKKPEDTANLRLLNVTYPASTEKISATITLEGVVRRVEGGVATYTESDDVVVREATRTEPVSLELVAAADLERKSWLIAEARMDGRCGDVIHMSDPTGEPLSLQFGDVAEAEAVLAWLRTHRRETLGGRQLYLGDPRLPMPGGSGRSSRILARNDSIFAKLAIMTYWLNEPKKNKC